MQEDRLNRLALVNIHPVIIINPKEVVDVFPRRIQLL